MTGTGETSIRSEERSLNPFPGRTIVPPCRRSAGRGKGGGQDSPIRHAEAAGEVVADGGLAAPASGTFVITHGDFVDRPGMRIGLVEPSVRQPDPGTARRALRAVDQGG